MAYNLIGKDFEPHDVVAKVTGRAKYAEDFRADGMVFCKTLTSPIPHARIRRIDTSAALKIKGVHDQNEYRRFYPTGEMASHIVGFTGDHDVGQEGIELTQQEWLGGKPGSRRVLINRRGEVVEDVQSIRAPQPGRDLALSIDARLSVRFDAASAS